MNDNNQGLQIYGGPKILELCQKDKKFAFVVALARAVNALNSAHSLMTSTMDKRTPAAQRDRMNSYFFASAILYETLDLIEKIGCVYREEKIFQNTLHHLLKDKTFQTLKRMHLKGVRRDAVFHYDPDRFTEAIMNTGMTECVFASAIGKKKGSIHYSFADYIAAEMMVGTRLDESGVVNNMMENTLTLVTELIDRSEVFIKEQLDGWGFEILPIAPDPQPGS